MLSHEPRNTTPGPSTPSNPSVESMRGVDPTKAENVNEVSREAINTVEIHNTLPPVVGMVVEKSFNVPAKFDKTPVE